MAPAKRRLIAGSLLVGTCLSSMEVMVVGPAMPHVVNDLGGAGLYPWVFTTYLVGQTLTVPVYGSAADRIGRTATYLIGVSLFLVGSVLCALAPSMEWMVACRGLQGLGAGALVPLTLTIFGDLYGVADRTKMQGAFSLVWGISSLLGPLIGGVMTEWWHWSGIFWINVIPGGIAALVVATQLPFSVGRETGGQRSPSLLRGLRLLADNQTQQTVWITGLALGAVIFGLTSYLPVWVEAAEGGGPIDAGLAIIPLSVAWTIAANVAGRLVTRTGFRRLVTFGSTCVFIGAAACVLFPVTRLGLTILGVGMGFTISTFTVAAQESAPITLRGTATSLTSFVRSLGGMIAIPSYGLLAGFDTSTPELSAITGLQDGLLRVFLSIAIAAAVSAIVVFLRFPHDKSAPVEA